MSPRQHVATENTKCKRGKNKAFVAKSLLKRDLEQTLGINKKQQNDVFETKGLWEM